MFLCHMTIIISRFLWLGTAELPALNALSNNDRDTAWNQQGDARPHNYIYYYYGRIINRDTNTD